MSSGHARTFSDPWIAQRYPSKYQVPHGVEPSGCYLYGPRAGWNQGSLDRHVLDIAFSFEFHARRVLAGVAFRGVFHDDDVLVWDYAPIRHLDQWLDVGEPGPWVRRRLDEALAIFKHALDQGLRVYQYDRPGYDEVTSSFKNVVCYRNRDVPMPDGLPGVIVHPAA